MNAPCIRGGYRWAAVCCASPRRASCGRTNHHRGVVRMHERRTVGGTGPEPMPTGCWRTSRNDADSPGRSPPTVSLARSRLHAEGADMAASDAGHGLPRSFRTGTQSCRRSLRCCAEDVTTSPHEGTEFRCRRHRPRGGTVPSPRSPGWCRRTRRGCSRGGARRSAARRTSHREGVPPAPTA